LGLLLQVDGELIADTVVADAMLETDIYHFFSNQWKPGFLEQGKKAKRGGNTTPNSLYHFLRKAVLDSKTNLQGGVFADNGGVNDIGLVSGKRLKSSTEDRHKSDGNNAQKATIRVLNHAVPLNRSNDWDLQRPDSYAEAILAKLEGQRQGDSRNGRAAKSMGFCLSAPSTLLGAPQRNKWDCQAHSGGAPGK
jgi:hypothetical protein